MYLGRDLQTSGFAVGRQLPADTCNPGNVRAERAGRQTRSPRASQACINGATGCVNKPTWLRINVGYCYSRCPRSWSGQEGRGGVVYNLWGVMPCCFGGLLAPAGAPHAGHRGG